MLDSLSVYRVIERQGQVGDTEMERRSLTPKPGGGGEGGSEISTQLIKPKPLTEIMLGFLKTSQIKVFKKK